MSTETTTEHSFCRICEALCGIEITKQGNQIIDIKPDTEHVATRGFGCAKGLKQHKLFSSPDRLKYPMKRIGDEWHRISWEQALQEIGQKVKAFRKVSPDSIAMYVGTAAGFGVLHPVFAQGFMTGIGSKSMYASATQDCSNKFAAANLIYGFPFTQPFPDIHHTDCMIVVGANPVISKWSFLQVPNPSKQLKEMEERGAKLYFIDPRKTESARIAGEHIFIRPGTDVFFYLSFLHEIIRLDSIAHERVAKYMKGLEQIKTLVAPWTPEKTASVTHIPAEKLREMVQAFTQAKTACFYSSTGVNMGGHGTIAFWLQEVINAITGNLDKRGGTLIGKGVIDFIKFGKKNGVLTRTDKSRIGNFTSVNDAFPGGILADEILTPGEKQIKALFVTGGNPLITMANSNRLRDAFKQLELLVALDILPTETAHLAHYALPCTAPLQRPDLPFIFPLMLGLQAKPYLQATKAILPPEGEQRDEASIYVDLAKACGISLFGSTIAQKLMEFLMNWHTWRKKTPVRTLPQESLLNGILKLTKQKSFKTILKNPHGIDRQPHEPESFLGKRVVTADQLVDLAPEALLAQTDRLADHFEMELRVKDKLKLITKRAVTTHNSWTHNLEEFIAGERHTNYLYMHPEDAQQRGITQGSIVEVSTKTGKVRLPVKLLAELMVGTVALPHGWGHQTSGYSVASKTQGVNVNILAADGPQGIDPVSGMAHLTGFLVDVAPTQEPVYPYDWSGIEPEK